MIFFQVCSMQTSPDTSTEIRLTRKKLEKLHVNTEKSAAAINLVYTSDTQPGIIRTRKKDGFVYSFNAKAITDKSVLDRIKKLVIPPAWENVWISPVENSHLLVTGTDAKGRKQYKYHPAWNELRNQTKFSHLYEFGNNLPAMRKQMQKHISLPGLPLEKVLATVLSVMQCTCIRIGNSMYEKLYGSYGLTTMKDKHVDVKGSEVKFSFKGKKGVYHEVSLKNRKLAKIVQQCREIPGKELFQYYDEGGNRKAVDSGMVNNYIREISGGNFTAKDFRTWFGSLFALESFKKVGVATTESEAKKNVVQMLDDVAKQLGNTRAVCRKYYVHPALVEHYMANTLDKFVAYETPGCDLAAELNGEERALMKLLETHTTTIVT
jgi:DNA topoisomerase-1